VSLWESVSSSPLWTGAGTAVLGFIGGHVKVRTGRLAKLETEVAECRKRDADFEILKAGVRMMVGEMKRSNPSSPALQMFGDLLERRLGPPPPIDDLQHLLNEIDASASRKDDE
jgi:hypothetical protein